MKGGHAEAPTTSCYDWSGLVVEAQRAIAVYRDDLDNVVIRAKGHTDEGDLLVILTTDQAVSALIRALRDHQEGGR